MMTCDEVRVSLALRSEDRSPAEEQRVRAHIGGCLACATRAEAYARQDRVIRTGRRNGLTASQRNQLLSTIEQKHARREARSRVMSVVGAVATVVAVIGMALGLRYLHELELQILPAPSHLGTPTAETPPGGGIARIGGIDFAVVHHELTPCVTAEAGAERCAPGGQVYLWVEISVKTVERPIVASDPPDFSVVYQTQEQPAISWLPAGRQPREACAPEGQLLEGECRFWIGAAVPERARTAELELRTEGEGNVFVWSLENSNVVAAMRPPPLVWPTTQREISGWFFRDPRNPDHPGIDIAADEGHPVFAVAEGSVIFAGQAGDYGNLVVIEHADGWSSYYGQLSEMLVAEAQDLEQGELLGRAGSTGHSSGPHLHFELRYGGVPVDPLRYLPGQIPLADLLIRADDLPGTVRESGGLDDWVARPMQGGELDLGSLADPDGCVDAWKVQGFREVEAADGTTQVVYTMHAVYRFEATPEAQERYEGLVRHASSHARERLYFGTPAPNTEAQTFAFAGQSDDVIYWLVAVDGQDVHLLMTSGVEDGTTKHVFDTAVARVMDIDGTGQPEGPAEHLAAALVQDPTAVCGWEVLGEREAETYVWAICQSPSGTAVSAPAVLIWSAGDAGARRLLDTRVPRDGTYYGEDVRHLFPPDVQKRIFDRDVDLDVIWERMEADLETVTGTVVDNAASARVLTLEDARGDQWHVSWSASRGVRRADGSAAQFRDIERGMRVGVLGLHRTPAATPNVLSAVRVTIFDEAFAASEVALAAYEPMSGADGVVQALSWEIAAWLAAGHEPGMLADALQALPKLDVADVRVTRVDLNNDGLHDVAVEPQFLGLPVLACLAQPGSGFACHPLPDPETLGDETLSVDSAVIPADVTGDGRPETLITYAVQAASGWRERVYVFDWGEVASAPDVVFYVELHNWAGTSTWELVPDPTAPGRQQIVLEYPHFYDLGFDHKLENHPLGRQVWRLDADLGPFLLTDEAVDTTRSAWGAGMEITTEDRLRWLTNEGETAFRTGRYEEALGAYDQVVALAAAEGWSPRGAEPDWVGLVRLRQGQAWAHLGRTDEAMDILSAVVRDYEGDLLGQLAAAFVMGYNASSTSPWSVEAGCDALKALEKRLEDHLYHELGGALRFPMTADGVLTCMP